MYCQNNISALSIYTSGSTVQFQSLPMNCLRYVLLFNIFTSTYSQHIHYINHYIKPCFSPNCLKHKPSLCSVTKHFTTVFLMLASWLVRIADVSKRFVPLNTRHHSSKCNDLIHFPNLKSTWSTWAFLSFKAENICSCIWLMMQKPGCIKVI